MDISKDYIGKSVTEEQFLKAFSEVLNEIWIARARVALYKQDPLFMNDTSKVTLDDYIHCFTGEYDYNLNEDIIQKLKP